MAARRKRAAKKKRAGRGSRRVSAAEKDKKKRRRPRAAAAPKKKRAVRRAVPKKRAASKKKRVARRVAPKKRAAKRAVRAAAPKKRAAKRVVPKKKRAAKPKAKLQTISAAQRAAITRTLRAFVSLPTQREYTRLAQKDIYRTKRSALIAALTRAGFSSASIRARLGWITRRRSELREDIATRRVIILGTSLLHGSNPDQRRILETMIREQDERFLRFAQDMQQLTLEWTEIINEWFSPKV